MKTCIYCNRVFSSSSNRVRHERLFHEKMSESGYDSGENATGESEGRLIRKNDDTTGKSHGTPFTYGNDDSDKDDDEEDTVESNKESDTEDDKEDEEGKQDDEDPWKEVLKAAKEEYGETSDNLFVEPYLSQFVEHVKDFVEEKMQFVKNMEFDKCYEKINKSIETYINRGFNRQEAVDAAWSERRFLVKQIMEMYKSDSDTE